MINKYQGLLSLNEQTKHQIPKQCRKTLKNHVKTSSKKSLDQDKNERSI